MDKQLYVYILLDTCTTFSPELEQLPYVLPVFTPILFKVK